MNPYSVVVVVVLILFIGLLVLQRALRRQRGRVHSPASQPDPQSSPTPDVVKDNVVLKQTITSDEVSARLFRLIDTDVEPNDEVVTVSTDRLQSESVYLQVFIIDLAIYLTLGDTPERNSVTGSFWDLVSASGLDGLTLNTRVDMYSDAVRQDNPDATFAALGATFARACLSPSDAALARIGSRVARDLTGKVSELLSSLHIQVFGS